MARKLLRIFLIFLICVITVIWIYPLLLILFNSFKPYSVMMSDFLGLPDGISFKMYADTWIKLGFGRLFLNTFTYTLFSVVIVVLAASMAAYKLSRTKTRYSWAVFMLCIMPLMVPFQSYMITLTHMAKNLGLTGSRAGLILIYAGLYMPLATFLYHGFIKTVPVQLDECAGIDGASGLRLFFRIIFPLLKPVTVTVIIIDAIACWNDFMVQLLFVGGKKSLFNIQNALFLQFSNSYTDWEHALPGIIISLVPTVIFFISMQKHILAGVTAGAVKG